MISTYALTLVYFIMEIVFFYNAFKENRNIKKVKIHQEIIITKNIYFTIVNERKIKDYD